MKKILVVILLSIIADGCAQDQILPFGTNVPVPYSAFNDIKGWWRADSYTGSSGGYSLTDLSGNSNNMTQQAGTLTPGTGVNSQAKFTGNSSAYFNNSSLVINNWPITIITIAVRANNATCGFFGETSSQNKLWFGYEASNQNNIYTTNSTQNTTSEAGAIAAYTARLGWGKKVFILNGVIQATHSASSVVQSSLTSPSIGTNYRGLNCDWYETLLWNRTLSLSELDEVHTYINNRYGMSIPLWSSYTPISVIWMAGQSNMAGRAAKAGLGSPYNTAQTNVNVWYGGSGSTTSFGKHYETLDESAFNNSLGDNGVTYYGMEATLGYNYRSRIGGSVYLFKYSQGGTPLNKITGKLFWQADYNTTAPNDGNKLYPSMMTNWIDQLIYCQSNSLKPSMRAFVWFQGEEDATDLTSANSYQTNIINFFNILRPELGTNIDNEVPPIYIGRLPSGQAGETYLSTLRTAQSNAVSILSNAYLFDTDSYSLSGDNVHFSGASYQQIGIDIAALIDP